MSSHPRSDVLFIRRGLGGCSRHCVLCCFVALEMSQEILPLHMYTHTHTLVCLCGVWFGVLLCVGVGVCVRGGGSFSFSAGKRVHI